MRSVLFATLLVLTAGALTRRSLQEPTEGKYYPDREAETICEELCKKDTGMDADPTDCLTECAVHTDSVTHHMNKGVEDFATDEAYNEQGGKEMEEKAEADHPVDVLDCAPQVDIDKAPTLDDLDTKQDGVIDQEEAREWGRKCCVQDEMVEQIFSEADTNQDDKINKEEFEDSGENTENEDAIDEALEKHSEGDDEYNQVQAPPLEEFDENKDGSLDENEHKDAVKFEMERRGEGRWSVSDEEVPEGAAKKAFGKTDKNKDGKIDGKEYKKPCAKGEDDFGGEINEAANGDEDAADPDDLARVEGADPAPAASMLSTRFKIAHRNEAAFLRRFNLPEHQHVAHKRNRRSFGHALVELAQKHHARRHQQHKRIALGRRHRAL